MVFYNIHRPLSQRQKFAANKFLLSASASDGSIQLSVWPASIASFQSDELVEETEVLVVIVGGRVIQDVFGVEQSVSQQFSNGPFAIWRKGGLKLFPESSATRVSPCNTRTTVSSLLRASFELV